MAGTSKTAAGAKPETPSDTARKTTDWHAMALMHHAQIRRAFTRALEAPPGGSRLTALRGLATLLNGHALAEEVVLYPALASADALGDAHPLYHEQAEAKAMMAMLEGIDPSGEDWLAKLQDIQRAVETHMRQEEEEWFPRIKSAGGDAARMTARYCEEFERYTRTGFVGSNAPWFSPKVPAAD